MPKAREPLPTRVALLHVAIHVLAVVFLGHNNVGVHWVHGPSPNWRLSRRTRVFLYFLHDRTIKRFTGIFFAFSLFHFSHASKTDFCGLFALMIPQYFGDPITGFAYTSQDIRRDPPPPPLDRRSCAVVVWRSSDEPFFWVRLFLYLFFFYGRLPCVALGHGRVLGVVLVVVDLDWRFGSRCGAQRVALLLLRKPWALYWCA